MKNRWRNAVGLAISMGLGLSMGCQTHIAGMTLPSPYYLKEKPDYVPPMPNFKLGRELAAQQAAAQNLAATPAPGAAAPALAPGLPPAPPPPAAGGPVP
jgi:hypothetical protein